MFGATHETDTETDIFPNEPSDRADTSAMDRARRRQIRRVVKAHDGPMTLDQLTDEIYRWELHRSATRVLRPDVREQLYHVELPALEHVGDADFDRDRGVITAAEETVPAILREASDERPDATGEAAGGDGVAIGRYRLAYLVAVSAFAAAAFGVGPFDAVSPALTLAVSLVALGVAAALDG